MVWISAEAGDGLIEAGELVFGPGCPDEITSPESADTLAAISGAR
jgi:hypothetical protein